MDATEKERRKPARFLQKMAKNPELWCIILASVFTIINKITESQTVNIPQQTARFHQPRPFFPQTSPVLEFYFGDINTLNLLVQEGEIVFVMYYAPWCSESMDVRWQFDKAAKFIGNKVKFVAVNCWWTGGQCRQKYKLINFSQLFIHHKTLRNIQYKGVKSAEHMVTFVNQIVHPLTPIHSNTDLLTFIPRHDSVVIGYFDFHASPQPPGFLQFYYAALRLIAQEPNQPVRFGVVTSPSLAKSFKLDTSSGRSLVITRTSNETVGFPEKYNFTSTNLQKWIQIHREKQIVKWIIPHRTKSIQLSTQIDKGPAVILFTHHNPMASINVEFERFREVALEYINCNSSKVTDIIKGSAAMRLYNIKKENILKELCKTIYVKEKEKPEDIVYKKKCCQSMKPSVLGAVEDGICDICLNIPKLSQTLTYQDPKKCQDVVLGNFIHIQEAGIFKSMQNRCEEFQKNYNANEHFSICCGQSHRSQMTDRFQRKSRRSRDPFVIANNEKLVLERTCNHLRFNKLQGYSNAASSGSKTTGDEISPTFTGLKCRTNKTVNFYAMDSKYFDLFATRLGVRTQHSKTSVVLVDKDDEAHYVLEKSFTKKNIAEFIHNYMDGSLVRYLRSSVTQNSSDTVKHVSQANIIELSTDTFHDVVFDVSKDVIVLYYAPWCGFCAGFSHVYLMLARYFSDASNITFVRINGAENDLPWELTSDSYPTILFFPAERKQDSVAFPDHVPKTLPHLVKFVLRYATTTLKMETALSICSRTCMRHNQALVRRQMETLRQQLVKTQARLGRMYSLVKHYQDSVHQEVYSESWKQSLVTYKNVLKNRVKRKHIQLLNARQLLQSLAATHGDFMHSTHLKSVVNRYRRQREQLAKQDNLVDNILTDNRNHGHDEL